MADLDHVAARLKTEAEASQNADAGQTHPTIIPRTAHPATVDGLALSDRRTAADKGTKQIKKDLARIMRLSLLSMHRTGVRDIKKYENDTDPYIPEIIERYPFLKESNISFLKKLLGLLNADYASAGFKRKLPTMEDAYQNGEFINPFSSHSLSLYDKALKGNPNDMDIFCENLLKVPFLVANQVYLVGLHKDLLTFPFQDIIIDIFETGFDEYKDCDLMVRFKNTALMVYFFLTNYKDFLKCWRAANNTDQGMIAATASGAFGFDEISIVDIKTAATSHKLETVRRTAHAVSQLHDSITTHIPTPKDIFAAHLEAFDLFLQKTMEKPFMKSLFTYAESYLKAHESLEDALESQEVFPNAVISTYEETIEDDHFSEESIIAFETQTITLDRANTHVYTEDTPVYKEFMHIHIKMHIEAIEAQLLETPDTYKETQSMGALKARISSILTQLKSLNIRLSIYNLDGIQAIFKNLEILHNCLETLKHKEETAAARLQKQQSRSAKPKKGGKGAKGKRRSAPKRAPAKPKAAAAVIPPAATASTASTEQLPAESRGQIIEIEKIVQMHLEAETTYLEAAEAFLIKNTTNGDRAVLQDLFDPKSNFKSILNLKDMEQITTHLQEKLSPDQKHPAHQRLGGANGVKFRVGDIIDTTHASSAEVGHKGHGGAVNGFKDFLLKVFDTYGQETTSANSIADR